MKKLFLSLLFVPILALAQVTNPPGGTSTNTPNALVKRDGSGNFAAGTISATLNGNATTATTAGSTGTFTGTFSGDVSGGQTSTVVNTVGGASSSSVASGSAAANAATSANTPSTIVKRDSGGSITVNTVTGTLNGNANTATSATTAGTVTGPFGGDVSGTQSNITVSKINGALPAAIATTGSASDLSSGTVPAARMPALSGDVSSTAGTTTTVVNTVGGSSASSVAAGAGLANAATNSNTASTIVKRDASGNFSAGTISADLNGNATTATTANTANSATTATTAGTAVNFSGSLSGDVTGTQGATAVGTVGGVSAANVASGANAANAATATNTPSAIVKRDSSGNFAAGTITGALAGNADTATYATTAGGAPPSGAAGGDLSGTFPAPTVSKVNGVAYGASPSTNTVPVVTGTNTVTYETVPVAAGGTGATTLTGYVKGSGTAALTASSTIPNTDISGLGTMSTQNAGSVAITGGTINGATIGGTTPAAGNFTTVAGAATSGFDASLAKVIAASSTTAASEAARWSRIVNVLDWGAKCDGATDDRAAIQAAINFVYSLGGGLVQFPRGICVVATATAEPGSAWLSSLVGTQTLSSYTMLVLYSNVTLAGQGIQNSILKGTNTGLTIVTLVSSNGGGVRDMSVLGSWTSSGAGHGIYYGVFNIGDSNKNLTMQNLEVGQVGSYGIGAQQGNYSNNKYDKIYCHDVGADCIDHKVRNGTGPGTQGLSYGVSFSNIFCERYGQRSGITNSTCTDVRGPATLTNYFVRNYGAAGSTGSNANVAVRFSAGTFNTNDTRQPSKGSSLSNFYIEGDCTRTYDTAAVILLSSESTTVSNGFIQCTNQGGVQFQNSSSGYGYSQYANVSNVVVQGIDTGTAFISLAGSTGVSMSNVKSIGQDFSFSSKQGNLSAGQTVFNTYYNPATVQVYKNGTLLTGGGVDYTAVDGVAVTLTSAVLVTDVLDVVTPNAGGFDIEATYNSLQNASSFYTTTPLTVTGGASPTFRAINNNFQQSGFTFSESGVQPIATLWSTSTNLDYRIDALGTGGIEMRSRGNRALRAENTANSTVNWLSANGSTTGNAVNLGAQGSDTDVSISLTPKGKGVTQTKALNVTGAVNKDNIGTTGARVSTTSATVTDTASSGTVAVGAINSFSADTLAASSATTFTRAATLYIAGAPIAGTNVTSVNGRALLVGNGLVELQGGLTVNSSTSTTLSGSPLKLTAGTTGITPITFASGPLNTTAVAGGMEFLTDKFYGTITTGAARKEFALWDAAGTSGRVPYETTNGRLTDAAGFTFNGTTLDAPAITQGGVAVAPAPLSGTTGSIGGGALLAGACTSGTVTVTGATTSMAVVASPATYPGDGAEWQGYVSSANTVTVKVCALVAITPTASTYNVRVLQ